LIISKEEVDHKIDTKAERLNLARFDILVESALNYSSFPQYSPDMAELSDELIKDWPFSTRVKNALDGDGITTIGELIYHSEKYLLRTPLIGSWSLMDIKSNLEIKGLQLAEYHELTLSEISRRQKRFSDEPER